MACLYSANSKSSLLQGADQRIRVDRQERMQNEGAVSAELLVIEKRRRSAEQEGEEREQEIERVTALGEQREQVEHAAHENGLPALPVVGGLRVP